MPGKKSTNKIIKFKEVIMDEYKNYLDNGDLPKPTFVQVDEEIDLLYETLERIAETSKIQRPDFLDEFKHIIDLSKGLDKDIEDLKNNNK